MARHSQLPLRSIKRLAFRSGAYGPGADEPTGLRLAVEGGPALVLDGRQGQLVGSLARDRLCLELAPEPFKELVIDFQAPLDSMLDSAWLGV